jgi:hypothetical protein
MVNQDPLKLNKICETAQNRGMFSDMLAENPECCQAIDLKIP